MPELEIEHLNKLLKQPPQLKITFVAQKSPEFPSYEFILNYTGIALGTKLYIFDQWCKYIGVKRYNFDTEIISLLSAMLLNDLKDCTVHHRTFPGLYSLSITAEKITHHGKTN